MAFKDRRVYGGNSWLLCIRNQKPNTCSSYVSLTLPGIRERKGSLRSQILLCMDEPENYEDSGWELRFMHEVFFFYVIWFCPGMIRLFLSALIERQSVKSLLIRGPQCTTYETVARKLYII